MITFPENIAAHDILHLGILFKRIRAARGLRQSDIAQSLLVTNSAISKFENTGRSRRARIIERYIRTLQSPIVNDNPVPCPLENDEVALLLQLNAEYHGDSGHVAIDQVSAYDFGLIASPYSPLELRSLVQRLRQLRWPAYISDGLGFIHAMNSAMLNFFGIAPSSLLLRRWESWHVLATNLVNPSPVRAAFISPDIYFPSVIHSYFRNTLVYLFTPQMRALLRELHNLSHLNDLYFSKWWYSATAFTIYFEQSESANILRYGERYLHASTLKLENHWVQLAPAMSVPYSLGIWQPLGVETQVVFDHLTGLAPPDNVFFAAEYDADHRYHVNCWPEVLHELQLGAQ